MPEKISKQGRKYNIDGRKMTWRPEVDDDATEDLPEVRLPLRIKLGLLLDLAGQELDNASMAAMLEAIIPNQMSTLREMDVNDFQDMFVTWQDEYNTLTGASLGESAASAS